MGLRGDSVANPLAVIRDLTIAEAHAAIYGVMHGVGIVTAYAIGLPGLSAGLVAFAFFLLGYLRGDEARNVPFVSTIADVTPKKIKGQIRAESHYYGFMLVATAAASGALYLWL